MSSSNGYAFCFGKSWFLMIDAKKEEYYFLLHSLVTALTFFLSHNCHHFHFLLHSYSHVLFFWKAICQPWHVGCWLLLSTSADKQMMKHGKFCKSKIWTEHMTLIFWWRQQVWLHMVNFKYVTISTHSSAIFEWVQIIKIDDRAFGTNVEVGIPRRALAASYTNFVTTFTFSYTFTFYCNHFHSWFVCWRTLWNVYWRWSSSMGFGSLAHPFIATFIFSHTQLSSLSLSIVKVPTLLESLGRCWRWPPSMGTGSLAAVVCNRGPRAYSHRCCCCAPKMLISYALPTAF